MASSRKDAARSAPRKKAPLPSSKPSSKPVKRTPINGKPAEHAHHLDLLEQAQQLLDDAHAVLTPCVRMLGGDDKAFAARLRINISLHLREVADFIAGQLDGGDGGGDEATTKGGAA